MDRRQLLKGGIAATAGGLLGSGLVAAMPPAGAVGAVPTPPTHGFWTRSGSRLVDSVGVPQRFAAANLYWLGLDDNLGPAPAYPTQQVIRQGLSAAAALGCTVVRSHTLGISVGNPLSVAPEAGEYNSEAFAAIDYAIATARELRLRLIIPLVDEWRYYHGGKWVFVQWAYEQGIGGVSEPCPDLTVTCGNDSTEQATESAFYSNPSVISLFEAYVAQILTHHNPLTGLAYRADPTILAWETGNELWDATPAWTAAMAGLLKQLAPRTLVADGSAATGLAVARTPGLGVGDIDIVGSHYYPPDVDQLEADASAASSASKIMVVGEWPSTTPGMPTGEWTAAIEDNPAISGDAVWSLLPWLPDGTPEPHSDGYCLHMPGATPAEAGVGQQLFAHAAAMRAGSAPTSSTSPEV